MKTFNSWLVAAALVLSLVAVPATAADLEQMNAEVLSRDVNDLPTFVRGELGALQGKNRRLAAMDYVQALLPKSFGALGTERMVATSIQRDALGTFHVRLRQEIAGLPVIGGELIVHARQGSGEVYAINGRFIPDRGLDREARLAAGDAVPFALNALNIVGNVKLRSGADLVYVVGSDDNAHLAWRTLVEYDGPEGWAVDYIFASATTGELVARHPTIHTAKSWRTYDGNNSTSLPGTLDCTNTGTCSDSVLQNIHNGASLVYNYYSAKFGRDSYTGAGATITSTGHYSSNYVNAFWNGNQLVYGDGDGVNSGPLGNAFDVVAHEFTHAVTSNESNLIYQNESGALNEGLSDIFAAAAESWRDGSVNSNTWKVGEATWTPGISGDALRYMNNPTQDGSSRDYYPERYTGTSDNGGVHLNSGIANLAFYLTVAGGSHPRGKTTTTVTGIGMTKAEQIYYRAQTTYLTSSSNFQAARNATASAAADLYGAGSAEVDAVQDAWCAVGVPGCPGGGGGGGACPAGFTTYTGTINAGQNLVTTGATAGGLLQATLTGSAPDIDLYLDRQRCRRGSCTWSAVASSTSASSTESISSNRATSVYRWRVSGFSGNGITFTLCANPAL